MIRVSTSDPEFIQAYLNASRVLPVRRLETPRQYGQRWREAYKCSPELEAHTHKVYYVFNNDKDYTWFILKWS